MIYAEFTVRIFWTLEDAEGVLGCPPIFSFRPRTSRSGIYAEFRLSSRRVDVELTANDAELMRSIRTQTFSRDFEICHRSRRMLKDAELTPSLPRAYPKLTSSLRRAYAKLTPSLCQAYAELRMKDVEGRRHFTSMDAEGR